MSDLTLRLVRLVQGDQGTVGSLLDGVDRICLMGELPWRENRADRSRIPAGTYRVEYLARSGSGKYRDVYWVRDVPGRSGILIHAGNVMGDVEQGYRADSWGCLLPGKRMGHLWDQRAVLSSRAALRELHKVTGRRPFNLEITDA